MSVVRLLSTVVSRVFHRVCVLPFPFYFICRMLATTYDVLFPNFLRVLKVRHHAYFFFSLLVLARVRGGF